MASKTLAEWSKEIHEWAKSKGWWDKPRDFSALLMNVHSEITEAWEEWRNNRTIHEEYVVDGKPEGIPAELADTMIRLLDLFAAFDIDIEAAMEKKMAYNRTRPIRHGGKKE